MNQQQKDNVRKINDFLGRLTIVQDLDTDQIDKITKIPGIIEYAGREMILEKPSIPKLMFVKYSPAIIASVPPNEIIQIIKNGVFLKTNCTN